MSEQEVSGGEIEGLYQRLGAEAEAAGYHLNPDVQFTKWLIRSLILNERRYGYPACPCRLASGGKQGDLDIVCPCDYRDADLSEYDACYCALYVSDAVFKRARQAGSIPERRPPPDERKAPGGNRGTRLARPALPVWRCRVCGYLCAREQPPERCPICKASRDRFERFM